MALWYPRRPGLSAAQASGRGLGLERFIMWITGMKNIRDVIPYPRTPGSADF